MTLDEYIILQKKNLEGFRLHHIKGVARFNWPTSQSFEEWKKHSEMWGDISEMWLKESGAIE